MGSRIFVTAIGFAFLFVPTAFAASQQDWDDCSSKDSTRSIPACGRIIDTASEDAQSRADAYLFRGGAYLAQKDFDHAVADYGEAIEIVPRNVTAYASLALAYWAKGDRERAIINYSIASWLDSAEVASITAANADVGAIGALARTSPAPVNVLPSIEQLRQFGPARLGVTLQEITTAIAEALNLHPPRGALVAGVDHDGAARQAGFEPGDVILRFDGRDIADWKDLALLTRNRRPGKVVSVVILRKGVEETRTVTLGRHEEAMPAAFPKDELAPQKVSGLEVSGLSGELREKFKIKAGVKGVVITAVDAPADASSADKYLAPGIVIVAIQNTAVNNPSDFLERLRQLKVQGRQVAILLISDRDGETYFVTLRI
jgi:tetratricopeptide (TPR) repeat protein